MTEPVHQGSHAICDYEGTSYRAEFWEGKGREYEDLAERSALRHLLPPHGQRLLEIGAGFGRLADLYRGYEQVILLDYAKSGLREAQARLGRGGRLIYVAADLYRLPLVPASCDTVVTVRVLHHVVDVPAALRAIAATLRPGGAYVTEYANKRNLKAIARYLLRRQRWSPFDKDPVEFTALNFDFHPQWMARELAAAGLNVEMGRAVSHFRIAALKRWLPANWLAGADALLQAPLAPFKPAPSVFLRCRRLGTRAATNASRYEAPHDLFRCPSCAGTLGEQGNAALVCQSCGSEWPLDDGIYDFKMPRHKEEALTALTGN